jgi:hypothetical protein
VLSSNTFLSKSRRRPSGSSRPSQAYRIKTNRDPSRSYSARKNRNEPMSGILPSSAIYFIGGGIVTIYLLVYIMTENYVPTSDGI